MLDLVEQKRTSIASRVFGRLSAAVVALAGPVALVVVALAGCEADRPPERLVLITLDTLRYDALFNGDGQASPMPRLRKRALGGIRFSRFYAAASTTQPTHATMFTALHPWQHGVTRNGRILSDDHHTLAETLRSSGFETHAVVAAFPVSRRFGFGQGFDSFAEEFSHGELEQWIGTEVPQRKFFALADSVTERALAAIDGARGDHQFFWFHYFDPHSPYGATQGERFSKSRIMESLMRGDETAEELLERARRLYRSDLEYLDRSLERLLTRLDAEVDEFVTHVFVVSDHGESFGEGGSLAHGNRLTEVEIHVPAFLISPTLEATRRDDVAGAIDVTPTLLALAGLRTAGDELGGRDLRREEISPPGVWGMRRTSRADRLREWRLDGRFHELPKFLFFAVDPLGHIHRGNGRRVFPAPEAHSRFGAQQLLEHFSAFEAQVRGSHTVQQIDSEIEAGLRALGYAP